MPDNPQPNALSDNQTNDQPSSSSNITPVKPEDVPSTNESNEQTNTQSNQQPNVSSVDQLKIEQPSNQSNEQSTTQSAESDALSAIINQYLSQTESNSQSNIKSEDVSDAQTNHQSNDQSSNLSKRALQRQRKKARKREVELINQLTEQQINQQISQSASVPKNLSNNQTIEQPVDVSIDNSIENDPEYQAFKQTFESFQARAAAEIAPAESEDQTTDQPTEQSIRQPNSDSNNRSRDRHESDEDDDEQSTNQSNNQSNNQTVDQSANNPSRRALRASHRVSLASLKSISPKPITVDPQDPNATAPVYHVLVKSLKAAVPVPNHWAKPKKFLQQKRGQEKLPFTLPPFLAATGISEMRGAQTARAQSQKGADKARDKIRPKMGGIEIDYQTLWDAFFKQQTKPKLSSWGAVYYEGKELATSANEDLIPGVLSDRLIDALGIRSTNPAVSQSMIPPPWLANMQRYGPPPSYPFLSIPGVNAPIPTGCRWGTGNPTINQSSGEVEWGRPPVDELNRPKWGGDLFGYQSISQSANQSVEQTDFSPWGKIVVETIQPASQTNKQSSRQTNNQSTDNDDERLTLGDVASQIKQSTNQSNKQVTDQPAGTETPAAFTLRKETDDTPITRTTNQPINQSNKQLYIVLPEKPASFGSGLMGTTHTYEFPSNNQSDNQSINVALDPEELANIDAHTLKRKYEAAQSTNQPINQSDFVKTGEQAKKKRKKEQETKTKFKF